MEIVLLGTGAAAPTLFRWPTSTAVIRGGEILLFDCGEGTQVQFMKAHLKPGKLTRIFISHFHGDHFNGLIGFLTSLQLGGREKGLHLYAPEGLSEYLNFMQKLSQFTFGYDIDIHVIEKNSETTTWELGDYLVTAMPLAHRMFVAGFRLEEKPKPGKFDSKEAERLGIESGPLRKLLQQGQTIELPDGKKVKPSQVIGPPRDGKKIAICMDTIPSENAVMLAENVDLLIHESTFDKSKSEWAAATGHSTTTQAAQVAMAARVKKLLLTHLSARYDREDEQRLLAQAKEIFQNTILGHDLMRIRV